ncbi:MAG: hypothetical protein U0941_16365 [Planctomycetaceae bacterium]
MTRKQHRHPSDVEFALLEIVALTPKSERRLNEFANWYDNGIAAGGHESMSQAIEVMTRLRAIEVLTSEAASLRSAKAAVRPYPLQMVRLPGTVDLTQFGAQLYERGLRKRKDHPDTRKVTTVDSDTNRVRHWQSGFHNRQIELPAAVLKLCRRGAFLTPKPGRMVRDVIIRNWHQWRNTWWQKPRRGIFVEFTYAECDG